MYAVSPSHSVFQPREAFGVTSFTSGAVTRSNRTFTRMSLNAAALCIATNNSRHPSKNVTKKYDATQRVKVDNELLDLEEAVKHNVDVMVAHLKKKWKGNKYKMLIGTDDVAVSLEKTFGDLSKWGTMYLKKGISATWGERDEFHDSKHPHHMFLLHHFDERLHMDSHLAITNLLFKAATADHWKHQYYIIPEDKRRVGMSCLGWGDGMDVGPRGKKRKKRHRKTNK